MTNSSTTGGYLLPVGEALPADASLEDVLQAHVVGITGLPGALVRPRWQPTVPKMPEPCETWAALGITSTAVDDSPVLHQGDGTARYIRHETIEVMVTMYGPQAEQKIKQLRDGLHIRQNNQSLLALGAKVIWCDGIRTIPEQYNMQWIRRYDMTYSLHRRVDLTYPIESFNSQPAIKLG